jgi:NIPSNAP protein
VSVVELRQYTLKPGQRDTLIALFEREFIESQEAEGIDLIGTFRDLGDPDRFVWLRGFPGMQSRAGSLGAFYGGPVWKANRSAVNETMIDSDNVLLLRPARAGSGFASGGLRPPRSATDIPKGVVTATTCHLDGPADEAFLAAFERASPGGVLASFVTEPAMNSFPALPVREGENVFVWFGAPKDALPMSMTSRFVRDPVVLRLQPTARSRVRG